MAPTPALVARPRGTMAQAPPTEAPAVRLRGTRTQAMPLALAARPRGTMAQAPPTQAPAVRLHGATAQAPPPAQTVRLRGVGKAIASFDLAILTRWTREASYVAMAWLVLIALNLVTTGKFFDV